MIQINQLKLPIGHSRKDLENKIRKTLKLSAQDSLRYEIQKRSIDARRKPELYYVYSILVSAGKEEALIKKAKSPNVKKITLTSYTLPAAGDQPLKNRPVVIGAGPAGLFAALLLCECGYAPLVLERGKSIEGRQKDVEDYWRTGILNTASNVQFGEGGAGTFSDGKLNTVVKDVYGRNRFVLETFVRFGASEQILYDAKPHIGTDVLSQVIVNMRNYMTEHDAEFRFETCVTDFIMEGGSLTALATSRGLIPCSAAVLAVGHSSRDTFEKLHSLGVPMTVKSFAVGFRVEHPQSMIDEAMYGMTGHKLPASPYKVTANFPNGRGVYSFCMCPGGYVVNASSEEARTVVNGMSYSGRNAANANSAIIVSVTPADFGGDDPLAGMRYQRQIEHEAYLRGRGAIPQQLYGDFAAHTPSSDYGDYSSCTRGATVLTSLNGIFNPDMEQSFIQGMDHFARIIPGFDRRDAILSGVESRTSSPLRIERGDDYESTFRGIYPCGEGAGYAGGITSAAMDGMKVAEAIIGRYRLSQL